MPRTYVLARPDSTQFRKRVAAFLSEVGYQLKSGGTLAAGTPDADAARWIAKHEADLLLLPFHLHRASNGDSLDGVGIALLLPQHFDVALAPILMPVSKYSWEASYERRMAVLVASRPLLAARILPLQEHEVGSSKIVQALTGRRGDAATSPAATSRGLKGFPNTSAMSGQFRAVAEFPAHVPTSPSAGAVEERPSGSWKSSSPGVPPGTSRQAASDETPSASWRTNNADATPSGSYRTKRDGVPHASKSTTSEQAKDPPSRKR